MEKIVVANLKMYLDTKEDVSKYQKSLINYKDKFIVSPPCIYLENFISKGFFVASQNVSNDGSGPYTGDISAKALNNLGVNYVIVGHSEIRKKYRDENNYIYEKVNQAIDNNLNVILCIGETMKEKNNGYTLDILKKQLVNIKPNERLIISYEPVWAINSNITPTDDELEEIVDYINNLGYKKVIYGGSVNKNNIERLNKIKNINGFLIGSAAMESSNLIKIIEVVFE